MHWILFWNLECFVINKLEKLVLLWRKNEFEVSHYHDNIYNFLYINYIFFYSRCISHEWLIHERYKSVRLRIKLDRAVKLSGSTKHWRHKKRFHGRLTTNRGTRSWHPAAIEVHLKLRERSNRPSSCLKALRTTPMLNRDPIEKEEEEASVLY